MFLRYQMLVHGLVGEGQDSEAALARVPLPIRAVVQRQVHKRALACEYETNFASDNAHVHRLAYLKIKRVHEWLANDPARTQSLFAEHRDPKKEADAWKDIARVLTVATVLVAGSFGAYAYWQHQREAVVAARAEMAGRNTAQVAQTAPRSMEYGFFESVLANYSIALDARSAGRERTSNGVARARAALESAAPTPVRAELVAYANALDAYSQYEGRDTEALETHADAVQNALLALNAALLSHNLPYFVDTDLVRYVDRNRAFVSSFEIVHTRQLRSGTAQIRALDLVRVDHVNHSRSALGYTRASNREALVLVEKIEEFLLRTLLPAVHGADQNVMVRNIEHESNTGWVAGFERQVHEDLLDEARKVVAERDVRDLARGIVTRKDALTTLNTLLSHAGYSVSIPNGYLYDTAYLERLRNIAPRRALQEVEDAQSLLDSDSVLAAYHALEESELHSVALHEAQHRLDYNADRLVRVPDALAEWTGRTQFEDAVNTRAERANAEMSAYLSQIAREPHRVRTNLAFLLVWLMDSHGWGHPECYAALVILEQLARSFNITHDPFVVRRRIQRAPIAEVYSAMRQHLGAEIAGHASALWQEMYGEPLPPLTGGTRVTR